MPLRRKHVIPRARPLLHCPKIIAEDSGTPSPLGASLWIKFIPVRARIMRKLFPGGSPTQLLHINEVGAFERLVTIGMAREDQKLSVRAHFFQNCENALQPFVICESEDVIENDQLSSACVLGQQFCQSESHSDINLFPLPTGQVFKVDCT